MNHKNKLLTSLILLSFFVAPALGVSVGYSAGDGGRSASSSATYDLDDSTSLRAEAILADDGIFETRDAKGSGNNSIEASASSDGSSVSSFVKSSGTMAVSSSVAATADGAVISQSADLEGKFGSIGLTANSKQNQMAVAGGFEGESGYMDSDLSAVAAGRAAMTGSASVEGIEVLNNNHLAMVASGDVGMSVDGLYAQPSGELGRFSLDTANVESASPGVGSSLDYLTDNPNAYLLAGWRWNSIANGQKRDGIKFYVKDDANLVNEGFSAASAAAAIGRAANTWDGVTTKNLFSDSGVTASKSVNADTYDKTNVAAWKYLSAAPNALAYSRTWYSRDKQGTPYYSALESDLCFNTKYGWSTSGKNYDVETVALHELGHTIGLGDLYGKPQYSGDTRQIMHYYTGVKRTLGSGDKNGAWLLYH